MGNEFLRAEKREDFEEFYGYNLDIELTKGKKVILGENYVYRRDFREGDVVTQNNIDFGYVYLVSDDEVKVEWGFGLNEWERKINLLIIPLEYGYEALKSTVLKHYGSIQDTLQNWFKIINGYSMDHRERDCLFNDSDFPKVDFIKYVNDDVLEDEKIVRKPTLYREIGQYKVFKAREFVGDCLSYDYVFFILDTKTKEIYFGGYKDEIRRTLAILYNK